MKLPCSVIVLIHKNSPTLWRCLSSVAMFEHIRVVDNHSGVPKTEFTKAGVSDVITVDGTIDDFASVRNQSMSALHTPWCFFIDSDEVLEPLTKQQLEQLNGQFQDPSFQGLSLKRSDVFYSKKLSYGEAGNRSFVRLMRPEYAHWSGRVHEIPIISGIVSQSPLQIAHYSHDSVSSFITDVSAYAKIVATERNLDQSSNLIQLLFFPPLKLLYDLFLLGGILDGWRGISYAYCMALHSLLVRIYTYEKNLELVSPSTTNSEV